MLPLALNIALMLIGYLLVVGYLAVGLRLQRRQSVRPARAARRRGWPGVVRQVVGTAVGGYVLLMVVVAGYYQGVAHLDGDLVTSAFTGAATLLGISLPVFFVVSWVVVRRGYGKAASRRAGRRL
ncbi:hypothetical protein J7E96_10510 [Streptomyces sp. ISL-96]|uniref:DUF6256 family protein n=1 Tax=Streptomyces sp. ISL-96 TaxID=2819191 RepID=UPI001BE9E781|nr:DUF6256 family protein [Streptomyces sp. ISL-96]MBT2488948.1 hypothetical protein [Streptomyces sp. ISL-96]